MNRPEWHWAIVGCASSAGLGIIMPAFALALSNVLGVFYNPDHAKMKSVIQTWCIVFGAVGGGALVCGTLQSYSFSLMGQKLAKRIRLMLMQALLKQVCCAVLCCAVLCCAVLCCAVLCCAVLCCAMLGCHVCMLTMSCHKSGCIDPTACRSWACFQTLPGSDVHQPQLLACSNKCRQYKL